MPYEITYIDNDAGVVTRYFGIFSDDDQCQSLADKTVSEEKARGLRYSISDYTDVTKMEITPAGVAKNAHAAVKLSEINKDLLVVLIVPSQLEYGMGRLFQARSDQSTWKTKLVRNRAQADEWINEQLGQNSQGDQPKAS
ncbi:hypothetical protein KAI87_08010 [Myxococcota bacterium]|nr:hypothetical protein [Myxococcota bacterium]